MLRSPCQNDDRGPAPALLPAREREWTHLAERVSHALRRTGHSALHGIGVSVQCDVVILQGCIASYYLKQLAQEAARHVIGGAIIRNELEVTQPA